MSKASKSAKKFTLKKKETTVPLSTTTSTTPVAEESNEIVNNINNNETDSTKSILKKKKVEKVEKKKVIFKTEKNQTQLFNKTLKIADKPLAIKKTTPTTTTPVEEEQVQQPEELIVIEKPTIAKKSKKQAQQNNKKEEITTPPTIVQQPEQPIVIEQPSVKVTETVVDKKKKSKKVLVESDSSSDDDSSEDEKVTTTKKEKKKENNTISGFIILPVTIENSPFKKYIYYKKETNKKWPQNKTLFVTNLPTHCTTLQDVQKLFKYDFIESVHFGQPIFNNNNNNGGFEDEEQQEPQIDETTKHVAHIVMKDQDSLNLFLKKSTSLSIQQPTLQLNGFDQLLNQYKSNIITDFETLQSKLDNIMIDYDKRVLETKKRSKQRQVPDEDGFITVGPSSAKVMTPEEAKAYVEKKTQKNFYAFQHRQNKKDELDILRAKFEEDKQKISKISAERKFKPY